MDRRSNIQDQKNPHWLPATWQIRRPGRSASEDPGPESREPIGIYSLKTDTCGSPIPGRTSFARDDDREAVPLPSTPPDISAGISNVAGALKQVAFWCLIGEGSSTSLRALDGAP